MSITTDTSHVPSHFAGVQSTYVGKDIHRPNERLGWEQAHRWSEVLHERNGALRATQYRTLVSAVRSGLPVVLTWRQGVDGVVYNDTYTVIVNDLIVDGRPSSDRIRVRYWGFGHDVYLSSVVSVVTPDGSWTKAE